MVSHSQSQRDSDNIVSVIVIDDDRDTVSVLSEFLQIKGMKVIGKGHDGMEAVEIYQKLRPDIVFLDVMMERYDGFYALEKIREIQPDAIVIMVTADMTKATHARLSELNASAIINKPYNINEIMHTINKLSPLRIECLD